MKRLFPQFALAVLYLAVGLNQVAFSAPRPTESEISDASIVGTSLIELIADPMKHDGKVVGVTGFLSTGTEDSKLYFSESHADFCISENAIDVAYAKDVELRPGNTSHSVKQFDRRYVFLCGRFNGKNKTLEQVVRVVLSRRFYEGGKSKARQQ